MQNLYQQFRSVLPRDPLLVGTVSAHNPDGTSTLTLPAGGTLRVQGQGVAVGSKAFIRGGRVQGEAPDLPLFEVEV